MTAKVRADYFKEGAGQISVERKEMAFADKPKRTEKTRPKKKRDGD